MPVNDYDIDDDDDCDDDDDDHWSWDLELTCPCHVKVTSWPLPTSFLPYIKLLFEGAGDDDYDEIDDYVERDDHDDHYDHDVFLQYFCQYSFRIS